MAVVDPAPAHNAARWLMAACPRRPIAAELFLAPAVEEAIAHR